MGELDKDLRSFARGMMDKHAKGSEAYDLARAVLRLMEERDEATAANLAFNVKAAQQINEARRQRDELAKWKVAAEEALDEETRRHAGLAAHKLERGIALDDLRTAIARKLEEARRG